MTIAGDDVLFVTTANTTMAYFALPHSATSGDYVDSGWPEYWFHYRLPGLEDIWGLGETEIEGKADLHRKIERIRKSLRRVW